MIRRPILSALAALLLLGAMPAAAAAAGPSFSIVPIGHEPYFVLHGRHGQLLSGAVRVVNVGPVAGSARLYAVDATTGQTSGAVYLGAGAPRRDVGAWTRLALAEVTLAPHAARIVGFTVRVPAGARPGQHLGGLVVAPVAPVARSTARHGRRTFRVNVREISIVAVLVDLPGPAVQRMRITGVGAAGRPGYQSLLIGLANTGDQLVRGSGSIVVFNAAGRTVLRRAFALDTFVPHTHVEYPVYVSGRRLPAGRYLARITISYGAGHRISRALPLRISSGALRRTYGTVAPAGLDGGAGSGSSLPAWAMALLALAILGLGAGGTALVLRRRAPRT